MPDYRNEMIDFSCELKDETQLAWIVVIDEEDYSVPKSISTWTPSSNDVDGTIAIPTWWAEKEGLA